MSLLTRLSLANRAIVALISILIIGIGVWATGSSKQELVPPINEPAAYVSITSPGASPATLDDQVVVNLSTALDAIPGVKKVTSATSNGSAQLTVTWGFGGEGQRILTDVRTATTAAVGAGPGRPTATVFAGSSDDIPVLVLSVTSDGSIDALGQQVKTVLVPLIEKVPGVRAAQASGITQERVVVTLDPAALTAKKVDRTTVDALLRTVGQVVPAGTSTDGAQALSIEVGQRTSTVEEIQALSIPTLAGPVPLSQVGTVALVPADQSTLARADGKPAIGLSITKTPDANAVQVSHAVMDALAAKLRELGGGTATHTVFDQSVMVEKSIHDLSVEGGLGLAFAVIVILVFLLSLRATIITAISIPTSLLIAVIGLKLGGYSLNVLTLAALTVAVGRVVDDSIVVIENIARRRGRGGLSISSVRDAVGEVAGAVTASTLTTVAVFLPVAFVSGVAGELFRPFAITVAVALAASLIVSLTIVPVMAYWFMRRPSRTRAGKGRSTELATVQGPSATGAESEHVTRMQRAYLPVIALALRRPVAVIIVACLALGGTVAASGLLKTDLLGSFVDPRAVQVSQKMPLTATLASSDETALRLEKAISAMPQVESYQTTVGSQGAPVLLDLVLTPGTKLDAAVDAIRSKVTDLPRASDITVSTQATQTTSSTIDVIVTGTNGADLATANDAIVAALKKDPTLQTVTSTLTAEQPVLSVTVDPAAAAAQGFGVAEVGTAIAAAVQGETLGTVTIGGSARDLVLRSQSTSTTPDAIGALPLPVSAIQQQRIQKDATDALTREQDQRAAAATADSQRSADKQLAELVKARNTSTNDLATLRAQLAELIASPPPPNPDPVTAGEIAAVQYQQLIEQTTAAIASTQAGLVTLSQQIADSRSAIATANSQQAESDRLTAASRAIENLRANPILVKDVAAVKVVNSPATITRIDGVRAVTVSAKPTGDLGSATAAVDAALAGLTLPQGVSLDKGGAAQEQADSFTQLGLAMLLALILVYIVLVATFRSLVQPLLLLTSVPLAATGALIGLLITGTPLGIPALIGMLMLIGIVVTNAIVLIDLINARRRQGHSIDEAVTHGARLRLRPIIMTACATIFALLPMALGITGGSAFISKSLAIVVIGGLVSSTALTLVLLPALYALRERAVQRRADRRRAGGHFDDDDQDGRGEVLGAPRPAAIAGTPTPSDSPDVSATAIAGPPETGERGILAP